MSCSSAAPSLGWSPRPGPAKNWRLPTLPSKTLTSTWVRSLFTRVAWTRPQPRTRPAHGLFASRAERGEVGGEESGFLAAAAPGPWLVARKPRDQVSRQQQQPIIHPSYREMPQHQARVSLGCTTVWLSGRLQPSQPSYHTFIISYLYFVFSFSPYATNYHNLSLQVKSDSLKDTHLHIMKIYV